MPYINFEGQTYYVPGVYTAVKVASTLPGPLPAFHIPVVMGRGYSGHPYDVGSKLVGAEADPSPFELSRTDSAAARWCGSESELHRAFRVAKRHGLPFGYLVNLSPMVRAAIVAETVGNVAQFKLYPHTWGPIGAWAKIRWTGTVWATTPVKRYAMISANVGASAVRIYTIGRHDWISVGVSVTLGSNTVAGVSRTVSRVGMERDANGQPLYWFEIPTTVGAMTVADYALVLQYEDREAVSPTLATCQELIDWLNSSSPHWTAVPEGTFTNAVPATVAAATPLRELGTTWGTVTVGTAPAPTNSDVQAFVAAMNAGEWAEFAVNEGVLPQAYLLVSGDSTFHGTMRDYAIAERARGYPISVTAGGRWGDVVIDAGDDTDPKFRVGVLNSQDVMLVVNGFNREAAYLSRAPAIFGRRVVGGPGHNLTNDEFVGIEEDEVAWDEINSGELSALCRVGAVTNKLSIGQTFRYRVSQGASTLQANATIWNEADATTWSVMQRDLMDFIDRVIRSDFEELLIGADKVDRTGIAQVLNRRAEKSLVARGYLKPVDGFRITAITLNDAGNGYDVAWSVRLPDTVDFITVTTTVLVGE